MYDVKCGQTAEEADVLILFERDDKLLRSKMIIRAWCSETFPRS